VLLAAARRFVVLLVLIGGGAVVVALVLGLLLGSSVNRSVSLGLYLAGAFLLVGGFVLGNRGPVRRADDGGSRSFGRAVRRASQEEMRDSVNITVLLVVLGAVLLALGAAIDSRYELI